MFSKKDISDKQDLSNNPVPDETDKGMLSEKNINEDHKKKEEDDFDRCWDEYDDGDEEDLSEENAEEKQENEYNQNNNSYKDYKYNNHNDYYEYKNNYSYGAKKYRKKKTGNKYQYDGYSNKYKQKYYSKDSLDYNYQNSNFINNNINYIPKHSSDFNNKYNNNTYTKYNSYKNKSYWNSKEEKNKKDEDILITKHTFTNSKLENNGNPEGNYVKIDIGESNIQKKNFNLINIGEVPINNKTNTSLLNINNKNKEIEQKIEESNDNKTKDNSDSGNLPWRNGGINKKDYYNNKKENNYYYNNKNYNNYYNYNDRNKYPLNQPKSKKSNKFD